MNKFFVLMLLILVTSLTLGGAQQGGTQGTQGTQTQQNMTEPTSGMAHNLSHLDEIIQQKQQEMEEQMTQNMGEEEKLRIENQNRVRLTLHTMIAMEYMLGSKGEQVSEAARAFEESLQATIMAEEKIAKRSAFTKFFVGGDEVAAAEIEAQVTMNQERIQNLNAALEDCDCDDAVKEMLQEQLMTLEQEQARLQQLADEEKQSKGLLGWLWK